MKAASHLIPPYRAHRFEQRRPRNNILESSVEQVEILIKVTRSRSLSQCTCAHDAWKSTGNACIHRLTAVLVQIAKEMMEFWRVH